MLEFQIVVRMSQVASTGGDSYSVDYRGWYGMEGSVSIFLIVAGRFIHFWHVEDACIKALPGQATDDPFRPANTSAC